MKKQYIIFTLALIALHALFSCNYIDSEEISIEKAIQHVREEIIAADTIAVVTTIDSNNAFNPIFLTESDVTDFMLKNPSFEDYVSPIISFYKKRNYQYAWFDKSGITEQASNFINILHNSNAKIDTTLIDKKLISIYKFFSSKEKDFSKHKEQQKEAELRLTAQFFRVAEKNFPTEDLHGVLLDNFVPKEKKSLSTLLEAIIAEHKQNNFKAYANPIYQSLAKEIMRYAQIREQWQKISPKHIPITQKDSSTILLIKKRLADMGDLPHNAVNKSYDQALDSAVAQFKKRNHITGSTGIDKKIISALNVHPDSLLQKLIVNLERSKWMPRSLPSTYTWVNIPNYRLTVVENNKELWDMKVVVGTLANSTVIFSDMMKYIVFSPYWGVPTSIVKKEIVPAMNKNPSYLENNDMEITGKMSDGTPIIKQKPGPKNSLGLVKFLFPNSYNIYFHDTPNKGAFSRSNRGLSHGCIRLAEPKRLAQWVLRYDTVKYAPHKIDTLMNRHKEVYVKLPEQAQVPVFIVYYTTWVDKNGKLNIRDDIYHHDKKMIKKLFQ